MMSMSIYRSRPSKRKRSHSVPMNLQEASNDFMKVVETATNSSLAVTVASTREEEREEPSANLNNYSFSSSCRSSGGEEDFFLPFDEDLEATPEEPSESMKSTPQGEKHKSQQNQIEAMAKLEVFFLGEATTFGSVIGASSSSPFSVRDIDLVVDKFEQTTTTSQISKSKPRSPKRNMFGDIMDESLPPRPLSRSSLNLETGSSQSYSYDSSSPFFRMLEKDDRANSLPFDFESLTFNDFNSSCRVLRRKSSLKKMSSFGQLSSSEKGQSESDGNLKKRNVSFSNLQIREYNVALSDHPSCSYGPPVQLSWDYKEKEEIPVESYERYRKPRRDAHGLMLSYYDRRFMLLKQAGYSKREVKEAMKEVDRVKRDRIVTDLLLPARALDETMEHVVDTVKNFFQNQRTNVTTR